MPCETALVCSCRSSPNLKKVGLSPDFLFHIQAIPNQTRGLQELWSRSIPLGIQINPQSLSVGVWNDVGSVVVAGSS